ncbi:MAG: class I SAM-dependent methyltransferase [Alphaproteobacteria bacterium]|nr:class I SAM-dependent methyltransferase [Alphaproteobacteria bacterium]
MRPSAADLRDFYGTGLGQIARRYVGRRIREAWPNTRGLSVIGLGYATPYLRPFLDEAARVVAAMPAAQGVHRWPRSEGELNRAFLALETTVPVPDQSMDRALLVHSLENSEAVRPLLREVWRLLSGDGRLLLVAPNRLGLWARLERTPFGHGHPYTPPQITQLLSENLFTPLSVRSCMYTPPLRSRFMLRSAPAFEHLGGRGIGIGGVLVAEASKQMYALVRPALATQRAPIPATSVDGG